MLSNSIKRVKFPIRTGFPCDFESRSVPSSGTSLGWDDDDDDKPLY